MEPKRVSRREILRSLGIAGAAAWASPVLTTARASAATDRCKRRMSTQLCKGVPCLGACTNGFENCGACSSDVGDGSQCYARYGDFRCFCAEDVFCSEAGHCTTDADCKAQGLGNVCITQNGCTNCDTKVGICSRRCCKGLDPTHRPALRPRRLGRTAAGR